MTCDRDLEMIAWSSLFERVISRICCKMFTPHAAQGQPLSNVRLMWYLPSWLANAKTSGVCLELLSSQGWSFQYDGPRVPAPTNHLGFGESSDMFDIVETRLLVFFGFVWTVVLFVLREGFEFVWFDDDDSSGPRILRRIPTIHLALSLTFENLNPIFFERSFTWNVTSNAVCDRSTNFRIFDVEYVLLFTPYNTPFVSIINTFLSSVIRTTGVGVFDIDVLDILETFPFIWYSDRKTWGYPIGSFRAEVESC